MESKVTVNNSKPWSWTEKQQRRHSRGRYKHMYVKPQGAGHIWNKTQRAYNKTQRAYNKRQLEKVFTRGPVNQELYERFEIEIVNEYDDYKDDVFFLDNNRHMGLWDLW